MILSFLCGTLVSLAKLPPSLNEQWFKSNTHFKSRNFRGQKRSRFLVVFFFKKYVTKTTIRHCESFVKKIAFFRYKKVSSHESFCVQSMLSRKNSPQYSTYFIARRRGLLFAGNFRFCYEIGI